MTLKPIVANHPILRGVYSFDGGMSSWRSYVTLQSNSTLVANWSDGTPLVAVKGRVVALNFYAVSESGYGGSWKVQSDGGLLMGNALLYGIIPQLTAASLNGVVSEFALSTYYVFCFVLSVRLFKRGKNVVCLIRAIY